MVRKKIKKEDIILEMYRKKEKEKRKLKEDNRSRQKKVSVLPNFNYK